MTIYIKEASCTYCHRDHNSLCLVFRLGKSKHKNMKIHLFICLFICLSHSGLFAKNLERKKNSVSLSSHLPRTYNYQVEQWVQIFQSRYSKSFRIWLERSYRYTPMMKNIFKQQNLPTDLVYLAMIESGFSSKAISPAKAVGYWQFIKPTALRFGLRKSHWLDERRDFEKSTYAAGQYLQFLYKQFGDWFLAAAAYNMGEKKLSRLIKKHKTKNFWSLSKKYDFPRETAQYIPKFIAALTITRAPALYGFNHLRIKTPYKYEIFYLPGGTNLRTLAAYIKQPYKKIKTLNPDLLSDRIPSHMENWRTRLPKGSSKKASQYISSHLISALSKK